MAKSRPSHCEEDIFRCLREKGVLLEHSEFSSTENAIVGKVSVVNLAYKKNVIIHCTYDNWKTSLDLRAVWAGSPGNTERPVTDRFHFMIPLPTQDWSGCVEFAIRYDVAGQTFWDNNECNNYKIKIKEQLGFQNKCFLP